MANKINKVPVWSVEIADQPGATADKLRLLAEAGADLQFLLARRQPDKPGKGIIFAAPIRGKKQEQAAHNAGFAISRDLIGVQVEGLNKSGLGSKFTKTVADAGVNLRGLAAAVIGTKFTALFAFDNASDADQGLKILRQVK